MSIDSEIEMLQDRLAELTRSRDDESLAPYIMKKPQRPEGFYWQIRWLAGRAVRWLRSRGMLHKDAWPVSLKHGQLDRHASPLLVWAVDIDRDRLREACGGIGRLLSELPGFAPVLVTDVADFAFFSRLGWLVEYLPDVSGESPPFRDRKARFVARLYFGAPAIPASVGLAPESAFQEIRMCVLQDRQGRS